MYFEWKYWKKKLKLESVSFPFPTQFEEIARQTSCHVGQPATGGWRTERR